jgi:hypothetical protein
MADGVLEARPFHCSRFEYATEKDAAPKLLDRMALSVRSGNRMPDLVPVCQRESFHPLDLEQFVIVLRYSVAR